MMMIADSSEHESIPDLSLNDKRRDLEKFLMVVFHTEATKDELEILIARKLQWR